MTDIQPAPLKQSFFPGLALTAPKFSVIIPVFREQRRIVPLLENLFSLPAPGGLEALVVDGDPQAATILALEAYVEESRPDWSRAVHCLTSPTGRGRQMNTGAQAAKGDVLLFLHADTTLPETTFPAIERGLHDIRVNAGAFSLRIESSWWIVRAIGHASTWRTRYNRVPFGDQALFFRRRVFHTLGGFQEIPVMEDLELMRRLRRQKLHIVILPEAVTTSGRRWETEGPIFCSLRNVLLRTLFALGVGPQTLARFYHRHED